MKIDHQLLDKYWAGQCTPTERQAVEAWMADGVPEEDFHLQSPTKSPEEIKSILWQNIHKETKIDHIPVLPTAVSSVRRWFTVAATIAIFCLLSFFYLYVSRHAKSKNAAETISYVQIEVPFGKKQKVTLNDGTVISLNSGTKFWYPRRFESDQREVFLEGEAFFEVSKDLARPFVVHTKNTNTRVLGTRFNLLGRKEHPDVLTVEEGRVQFTATGCADTLILEANMQSIYTAGKMNLIKVRSEGYKAWTKGELIFSNKTLKEVIPELERWYNVDITCKDSELLNYRVKGKFKQASLATVLHDIAFALAIEYTIKDKEVSLYK